MFGPHYTVGQTIFKAYSKSDLFSLLKMLRNPQNRQFYDSSHPLDWSFEDLFNEYEDDTDNFNSVVWGIYSQEGVFQGRTGLFKDHHHHWHTSIIVDQAFWGQKIQKKSLQQQLLYATYEMQIPAIYTHIRHIHTISLRNVINAGFSPITLLPQNFTSPVDGTVYDDVVLVWINPFWAQHIPFDFWPQDLQKAFTTRPKMLEVAHDFLETARETVHQVHIEFIGDILALDHLEN